jgi:hypothetical protein
MRKLGFAKSRMQFARNGLTYVKDDSGGRITVTIPKGHETTFHIMGDTPNSGIFVKVLPDRPVNWGIPVDTEDLGLGMLEVCLGLCSGDIQMSPPDSERG